MRKVCITENCLPCSVRIILLQKTSSDNDYQPNILKENIEKENGCNTTLTKKIILKKSREVKIKRNQKLILRYYKPNR